MPIPKQLAVDVVLLLPPKLRDRVINLNKRADKLGQACGKLGKTDFVPHISLAMGGVKVKDLSEFKFAIKNILKKHEPIKIIIDKQDKRRRWKSYAFRIKKTPTLKKLHSDLMNGLEKNFIHNCTKHDIYAKPGENIAHPKSTNIYYKNFAFKNFAPHITLLNLKKQKINLPINFTAKTIAAFQVGVHTTCRKKLFSFKLK